MLKGIKSFNEDSLEPKFEIEKIVHYEALGKVVDLIGRVGFQELCMQLPDALAGDIFEVLLRGQENQRRQATMIQGTVQLAVLTKTKKHLLVGKTLCDAVVCHWANWRQRSGFYLVDKNNSFDSLIFGTRFINSLDFGPHCIRNVVEV